jgi:thiamine biosynthesis lipoprotein
VTAFAAMGTDWWIHSDRPDLHAAAVATVRGLEARLSRFVAGSAVCRLRADGVVTDAALARVVEVALALSASTDGAFSILLGRELADLGYDRTFGAISGGAPGGRPSPTQLRVDGDRVTVEAPGPAAWVDVGGIAKGWTVDHVHDRLRAAGASWALVDGGGDLRGSGRPWPVGVGEAHDGTLHDAAVATSSALGRRWRGDDGGDHHDILDPRTGRSAGGPIVVATVHAADATTADALATALIADPRRTLPRLRMAGFEASAVEKVAAAIAAL